jgi:hypothetical protein
VDWRLLVKEHTANIGIPLDVLGLMFFFLNVWVFANEPTVHSGGGFVAVAVGVSYR